MLTMKISRNYEDRERYNLPLEGLILPGGRSKRLVHPSASLSLNMPRIRFNMDLDFLWTEIRFQAFDFSLISCFEGFESG